MARPTPADDQATARLASLDLGRPVAAWVPDQPDLPPEKPAEPRDRVGGLPDWAHGLVATANLPGLGWVAVACAVCVAVTAFVVTRHRGGEVPTAYPPVTAPVDVVTAAPSPTPGVVVDVGGRVRHPGLVTLPTGSRVADALRAAGGALRPRDLAAVNLAARVADGQLLLVGVPGSGGGAATAASGADAGPVNLNSASVEQLDTLPGIGPVLAQRIVDWRTVHGSFDSVEQLKDVSGIGDSIYADISGLVAV